MKKIFSSPLFIPILFIFLFLFGSLTSFYGLFLFIPVITHYFRGLLNLLPTILTYAIPLFLIIILWIFIHNKNVKSRWKTIYICGLILTGVMFICLISHLLIMGFIYDFKISTSISPLFPYDVLVFQIIYFAIGIICLIHSYKTRDLLFVAPTFEPLKKRKVVAFSFMVALCEYFLGILVIIPDVYFDGYIDSNWWMIIPTLLLNLLPVSMLIIYFLYKHIFNTRKFFLVSLISLICVTLVLVFLLLVSYIVNPKYIYESMQPFYQLGLTINIPFTIFLIPIGTIILLIVATRNFLKNNNTYEKETKN